MTTDTDTTHAVPGDNSLAAFDAKKEFGRIHKFAKSTVQNVEEARSMAVLYVMYSMSRHAQGDTSHLLGLYNALMPLYKSKLSTWVKNGTPFYLHKQTVLKEGGEKLVVEKFKKNKKREFIVIPAILETPFDRYKAPSNALAFDMLKRLQSVSNKIAKESEGLEDEAKAGQYQVSKGKLDGLIKELEVFLATGSTGQPEVVAQDKKDAKAA